MRYRVDCAFLGAGYYGWQIQDDVKTIQGLFNDVLSTLFKAPIHVVGCSRTDALVSAAHFVFHFDGTSNIPTVNLKRIINNHLPPSVHVLKIMEVSDDFHARNDARLKTYRYTIETGPYNVLEHAFVYQYNKDCNVKMMQATLDSFVGTHDFTSFNATPLRVIDNQVRTITKGKVNQEGSQMLITITGDGFLHHMIRMIVGTMIAVSEGKLTILEVQAMLAAQSKGVCRYMAPPQGLLLERVYYED